jgi:uncharacterized protein
VSDGQGARLAARFNVTALLRRPGVRHPLAGTLRLEELRVRDAVIAAGSDALLDLEIEAINDAVTAAGTVRAPFEASCRRCLEDLSGVAEAEIQEIFERRPVEGETYLLDGEIIDLEPLVRDSLLLALPLAPLCRDDCPGPAPELFPTGQATTGGETDAAAGEAAPDGEEAEPEPPTADPRWAALRDLKLD